MEQVLLAARPWRRWVYSVSMQATATTTSATEEEKRREIKRELNAANFSNHWKIQRALDGA